MSVSGKPLPKATDLGAGARQPGEAVECRDAPSAPGGTRRAGHVHAEEGPLSIKRRNRFSTRRHRLLRSACICVVALVSAGCAPQAEPIEKRLEEIRRLQASEHFEESIAPLEAILTEAPGHAEANHLLGTALLRTGAPTLALWPLRRASRDEAFAIESGLLLASALLASGNWEEAAASVEAVLARDPKRVEAHLLGARARLQLREPASALAHAEAALELAPTDLAALWQRAALLAALGRHAEAAEAFAHLKERAESERDAALAARSCTAVAFVQLRADQPETPARPEPGSSGEMPAGTPFDPELTPGQLTDLAPSPRAASTLRQCVEAFPTEHAAVAALAGYLGATGESDQALAVWRQAVDRAPESLVLRAGLANQLWVMDRRDPAKQAVRELAERTEDPLAWQALAELQRLDGEFEAAAAALETALAKAPDRVELRFQLANLLLDGGQLDAAEAQLASFQRPEYRDLLRGRLLLERGDPLGALAAFESGIAHWPNNAVARALAGHAAQQIGDLERALEQYRESIRADARATDAGLAAARIAFALGKYADAAMYAGYQIRSHPYQGLEPYRLGALAAQAAGMQRAVEQFLEALAQQRRPADTAILRAQLAGTAGGPAKEVAVLEESGLDFTQPENEAALRELAHARVAADRRDAALALVDQTLAARNESADLLDLRGRVLLELDRDAQARVAFDRALVLAPDHAPTLAGLGAVAFRRGSLEEALEYFDRALKADPSDPESAYRAAQIAAALGRSEEAEQRLRALVSRDPGHLEATNHLAWLLAEQGQELTLALTLAKRAATPGAAAHVLDTLAYVQLRRGELEDAKRTLEAAITSHPADATLRYRLGTVLLARGETEAARRALQQALNAGPFPEADAARETLASLAAAENGG